MSVVVHCSMRATTLRSNKKLQIVVMDKLRILHFTSNSIY